MLSAFHVFQDLIEIDKSTKANLYLCHSVWFSVSTQEKYDFKEQTLVQREESKKKKAFEPAEILINFKVK
jgi:uncharacterized protein YodC (DUF2158 family)